MNHGFLTVEDHEEFLGLVEDSDSGLYVQELWQLHSMRRDQPVSSQNIARKAFQALYQRQGWDESLMRVTPGIGLRPLPEDLAAGKLRRRSFGADLSRDGFWWASAPFGYQETFDDEAAHIYEVHDGPLHIALWAFEYTSRIAPDLVPPLPEFQHQSEIARQGSTFYYYDTSPEAPRSERDLSDLRRRWAGVKRRMKRG